MATELAGTLGGRIAAGILGCLAAFIALYMHFGMRQADVSHLSFRTPFAPLLPMVSMAINLFLMCALSTATWIRLAGWCVVGGAVYFLYGVDASVLAKSTASGSTAHAGEQDGDSSEGDGQYGLDDRGAFSAGDGGTKNEASLDLGPPAVRQQVSMPSWSSLGGDGHGGASSAAMPILGSVQRGEEGGTAERAHAGGGRQNVELSWTSRSLGGRSSLEDRAGTSPGTPLLEAASYTPMMPQ